MKLLLNLLAIGQIVAFDIFEKDKLVNLLLTDEEPLYKTHAIWNLAEPHPHPPDPTDHGDIDTCPVELKDKSSCQSCLRDYQCKSSCCLPWLDCDDKGENCKAHTNAESHGFPIKKCEPAAG